MIKTITLLAEDISNAIKCLPIGSGRICQVCPIAQAVKRSFPEAKFVEVRWDTGSVDHRTFKLSGNVVPVTYRNTRDWKDLKPGLIFTLTFGA